MATKKTVETVETEEVKTPEVETEKKSESKKVWTEEELAVLPRERFLEIEADIRNGKATVKPRFED